MKREDTLFMVFILGLFVYYAFTAYGGSPHFNYHEGNSTTYSGTFTAPPFGAYSVVGRDAVFSLRSDGYMILNMSGVYYVFPNNGYLNVIYPDEGDVIYHASVNPFYPEPFMTNGARALGPHEYVVTEGVSFLTTKYTVTWSDNTIVYWSGRNKVTLVSVSTKLTVPDVTFGVLFDPNLVWTECIKGYCQEHGQAWKDEGTLVRLYYENANAAREVLILKNIYARGGYSYTGPKVRFDPLLTDDWRYPWEISGGNVGPMAIVNMYAAQIITDRFTVFIIDIPGGAYGGVYYNGTLYDGSWIETDTRWVYAHALSYTGTAAGVAIVWDDGRVVGYYELMPYWNFS